MRRKNTRSVFLVKILKETNFVIDFNNRILKFFENYSVI